MLKSTRQNIHRHKLPSLGAVVEVHLRPLMPGHHYQKYVVVAFPLTDSPDPRFSLGIHTCFIARIDRPHEVERVSGHWCVEVTP